MQFLVTFESRERHSLHIWSINTDTSNCPLSHCNIVPYLSRNEWSRGGPVLILTLWSSKVASSNSHSIASCKAHEQIPISFWVAKLIGKSHSIPSCKIYWENPIPFQISKLMGNSNSILSWKNLWGSILKIWAHFIHSIHSHLTSSLYCRNYYHSLLLISPLWIKLSSLFNPKFLRR